MIKMATSSGSGSATAAFWFQFFLDAGIPPSDAGNYAVTFMENRIQQDMIVDLTKDYLSEMGITVLGDMIAILKHAKQVHTQANREKVLKGTGLSSVAITSSSSSSLLAASGGVSKSSAVAKVSVPVRPSRATTDWNAEQLPKTLAARPALASQEKSGMLTKKTELQKLDDAYTVKDTNTLTKKIVQQRIQSSNVVPAPAKGEIVYLKAPVAQEAPQSKIRNIAQEHESSLKVVYPSGLTKKTRMIMSQLKKSEELKHSSVFDRLGEERVESQATDSAYGISANQKEGLSKASTVFCRLGEKKELKRPGPSDVEEFVPAKKKASTNVEERLEGPVKVIPLTTVSAGILGTNSTFDSRPIHLRLGNKSTLSQRNEEVAVSSSATAHRLDGKSKTKSLSASNAVTRAAKSVLQKDSSMPNANKFKKITFTDDKDSTLEAEGQKKLFADLVIRLDSRPSGSSALRQIGKQNSGGQRLQSEMQKPGNVLHRLGPQKTQSELQRPVNVMGRLGLQKSGIEMTNLKPQNMDDMSVTVQVTSTSKPTQAGCRTGVFSRLGGRTLSK